MRKEYDLKALTVKRRGPLPALKKATRRETTVAAVKKVLLKDPDFIRKVAAHVNR